MRAETSGTQSLYSERVSVLLSEHGEIEHVCDFFCRFQ